MRRDMRTLALKLLNAVVSSERMQERFWREAEVIQPLESELVPVSCHQNRRLINPFESITHVRRISTPLFW